METTSIYVEENGRTVDKQVLIQEAIEIYRKDPSAIYTPLFFQQMKKLRTWQNEIGYSICKMLDVDSVFDLGCAQGYYLEGFLKGGASKITGIECAYESARSLIPSSLLDNIFQGDAQQPNLISDKFDFVMSVEVAEHILTENSRSFVGNICNCEPENILFSAGEPGQKGLGHINNQPLDYWKELFKGFGYKYDETLTQDFRRVYSSISHPSKYSRFLSRHVIGLTKNVYEK